MSEAFCVAIENDIWNNLLFPSLLQYIHCLISLLSFQDQPQSSMSLVLQVPIGQTEHCWPIIALTVLSTMVGCVLILWNSLEVP